MAKRKTVAAKSEEAVLPSTDEYTVLARRYRPQQFKDLVGQEPVAQGLVNALATNRVAHAYLFTGARGVGKTSAARILAKALNCVKGPTATPCDQCEMCRSIAAGEDIDVLEIDGASNRGIDEVREIRQNVQYRPGRARYKIYIIDEVHMLTTPAFNALLKTLEEPPGHVKFIFATTEVHKIPITILSRCQRYDFAGIGSGKIVERLRQIVADENLEADDEALMLIARRAGGSMRDAQSLLDQLLAFGGEGLTVDKIHTLLGTAHQDRIAELAAAILEGDTARALSLLATAADQGLQLGEFLDQLIEYWRDLMVAHSSGLEDQVLSQTGAARDTLLKQAQQLELDTILAGLDVLVTAKSRMRTTSHARVLIEMAVARLSRLEKLVAVSQLAQALAGEQAPESKSVRPSQNVSSQPARISGNRLSQPAEATEKKKSETDGPALPLSEETVQAVWQRVLAEIGPIQAGFLGKVERVATSGPNCLVLRVPSGYNENQGQYLDSSRVAKLEELLGRITGNPCSVRLEASMPGPTPAVSAGSAAAETMLSRSRRQRDEAARQPLVTRAMELLGAQIIQMEDDWGATQGSPQ